MSEQEFLVKKHTATIHIKGDLDLVQRKLMNALLFQAYDNIPNKLTHEIDYHLLCSYMDFDSKNVDHIKKSLEGLMKTIITWNYFGKNGRKIWGGSTLLSSYQIKNGIVYYEYSQMLLDKIYNPEIYSRINLNKINRLSSKYSIILYENCFRFLDVGSTGWIEIDTFKGLMGVDEYSSYKDRFFAFKGKVLNESIKEINSETDIKIEAEYKKTGRNISHVKFSVSKKILPIDNIIFEDNGNDSDCFKKLIAFGVNPKLAHSMIANHGEEYILEKIKIAEKAKSENKINSSSGFLISAIKNDYKDADILEKEKAKKLAEKAKKIKGLESILETLETDKRNIERAHRGTVKEAINQSYNTMSDIAQKAAWYSFAQNLEGMRLEDFKKHNWESSLNYVAIKKYWAEEHKIEFPDIEETAKEAGVKGFKILSDKISKVKLDLEKLKKGE